MQKTRVQFHVCALLFAMALSAVYSRDPDPLQDFCVGVNNTLSGVFVNGMICKNPNDVTVNDFIFRRFNTPGNTSNRLGSLARMVNATEFPALNTQGITIARIDYEPDGGLNPPHSHPRSSEVLYVMEGILYVGFVTSNLQGGGNRLFAKVLTQGDLFVFPQGLIHFQLNVGSEHAVAIATFGSQNPGLVTIANAVFGSTPPIIQEVLTRAFQINDTLVEYLQFVF